MPSQTKLCSETINLSSFKVKLRCDHTIYKPRRLPIKNRCLTHLDLPCHHFIAQNRRGLRCQSNAKVRKDPKGPFCIQRLHSCCPAVDKWALQKQITWLKTREKKNDRSWLLCQSMQKWYCLTISTRPCLTCEPFNLSNVAKSPTATACIQNKEALRVLLWSVVFLLFLRFYSHLQLLHCRYGCTHVCMHMETPTLRVNATKF